MLDLTFLSATYLDGTVAKFVQDLVFIKSSQLANQNSIAVASARASHKLLIQAQQGYSRST